jgi:hypothetical protein
MSPKDYCKLPHSEALPQNPPTSVQMHQYVWCFHSDAQDEHILASTTSSLDHLIRIDSDSSDDWYPTHHRIPRGELLSSTSSRIARPVGFINGSWEYIWQVPSQYLVLFLSFIAIIILTQESRYISIPFYHIRKQKISQLPNVRILRFPHLNRYHSPS